MVKKLSRLVVASAVSPLCPDRYECRAIELYRFDCIKEVLTMPSCVTDDFVYEVLKKYIVLLFFLLSVNNFIWFYQGLAKYGSGKYRMLSTV